MPWATLERFTPEHRAIPKADLPAYQIATATDRKGKLNNYGLIDFEIVSKKKQTEHPAPGKVEIVLYKPKRDPRDRVSFGPACSYIGMLDARVEEAKLEIARHEHGIEKCKETAQEVYGAYEYGHDLGDDNFVPDEETEPYEKWINIYDPKLLEGTLELIGVKETKKLAKIEDFNEVPGEIVIQTPHLTSWKNLVVMHQKAVEGSVPELAPIKLGVVGNMWPRDHATPVSTE